MRIIKLHFAAEKEKRKLYLGRKWVSWDIHGADNKEHIIK